MSIHLVVAQNDYKISSYSFSVKKLTEKAIAEINAKKDKEKLLVEIESECSQKDFDAICKMDWIQNFKIKSRNEQIKDLSAIAQLKNLNTLEISSFSVTKDSKLDIEPISKLTELVSLTFYATKVGNTDGLGKLSKLKELSLYMADVSSISFIKNLPLLEKLDLYGAYHTFPNYEPLAGLKNLKELNIYMNPQAKDALLGPISKLTSLEVIEFSNCSEITNLNFLKNCLNLKRIDANWSGLTNISGIANLSLLEELYFSDCKLTDISSLKSLTALKTLRIENISVSDLTPIHSCTSLTKLYVSNKIKQDQLDALKLKLPEIEIDISE